MIIDINMHALPENLFQDEAVLEEHRASIMNAIRETMRQLSDEDLRDVSNTLRKLQDTLSKLH